MRAEIPILIRRAEDSLRTAKLVLDESTYEIAASLAYFAMFYAASAALLTRGLRFKRHASLVRGFAAEFVKTGLLPARLQADLGRGFIERIRSDYAVLEEVTREDAEEQLKRAEEFVATVKEFLERETET
ncbi:MAG: HEPN domain-containing protein [Dehalococcoidia bacterium]